MAGTSGDMNRQIDDWAEQLISRLSPAEQRKLARQIDTALRRENARRIRKNIAPDGSAWPARKRGKTTAKNTPKRFIYDGRERYLKSYQRQGGRMTGYDRLRPGIRTFRYDRVERWLPPGVPEPGSDPAWLKSHNRQEMYKGLAKAKSLKVKVGPQGVMVGFYGRVARIARVAQYGLYDNVRPGGPRVKYDQRELLGFTDADYDMIRDLLAEHLGGD